MANKEAPRLLGESRMRKTTEHNGLALNLAVRGKPEIGESGNTCRDSIPLGNGIWLGAEYFQANGSLKDTHCKSWLGRSTDIGDLGFLVVTDFTETSITGDRFSNSRQIVLISKNEQLYFEDRLNFFTGISDKTMPQEVRDVITEFKLPSVQGLHIPILEALRQV